MRKRSIPLVSIAALVGAMGPRLAAQPPSSPATEPLPAASAVLDRYIEALGGEEAIRRHQSVSWKGKFAMPGQGLEGDLALKAAAPNLFRLDITAPGLGTISQGFDGKVGWSDNPMTGPTLTKGAELEMLQIQSDFYLDLHFAQHYPVLEVVSKENFADEPCYKLKATTAAGLETFTYFSVASGLQVGVEADVPTAMGDVWVKTVIAGYKDYGGRVYPTVNRQEMMGTEQVITLEEPDFSALDPSVFALPEAIRTLVDGQRAQ
jgi:hypothetical protein